MTLSTVLFDLGGTLLHYHDPRHDDPQRPFRRVTMLGVRAIADHLLTDGHRFSAEEFGAAVDRLIAEDYRARQPDIGGGCVEGPLRGALAEVGVAVSDAEWASLRVLFYRQIDPTVSPRTGVRQTLADLRGAGYRLGLVSNTYWMPDLHDRHLAEHELLDFLPVRIYSSQTAHTKPHPSIFLDALAQLDAVPAESVYVGDRAVTDVGGAKAAGMRGVLIRSPYLANEADGVSPDAVIDELPDLLPILETL